MANLGAGATHVSANADGHALARGWPERQRLPLHLRSAEPVASHRRRRQPGDARDQHRASATPICSPTPTRP